MGYTHYWRLRASVPAVRWTEAADDARALVEARADLLSRRGDPEEPPVVDDRAVVFNGREPLALETFTFHREATSGSAWTFCKTNRLPYDEVAVAVLCALAVRLGDLELRSDGEWSREWVAGRTLARRVLGLEDEDLETVADELRRRPDPSEFARSLVHFLDLPEGLVARAARQLVSEARRRTGTDLAAAGFFLMPRAPEPIDPGAGAREIELDLLSPDNRFTRPVRIEWRRAAGGEVEASWVELPDAALQEYLAASEEPGSGG